MTVRVALGQLESSSDKQQNLAAIASMTAESAAAGAHLALFPEIAMVEFRQGDDARELAEPLDGPFARGLSSLAETHRIMILAGMLEAVPGSDDAFNTVVGFGTDGSLLGSYRKVHLYDAFGFKESDMLQAGSGDTLLFSIGDITFGVLTCYDVRFPELATHLVEQGATCILVPAAWVRGPLKESQWEILLRARAIENTVYVAGAGLIGERFCGNSMLVDPMGVPIARAAEAATLIWGDVSPERVREVRRINPTLANRRPDVYRARTREAVLRQGKEL